MTAEGDPITLMTAAAVGSGAIGAASSVAGGIQAQKAGEAAAEQAKNQSMAALTESGAQISASEMNAERLLGRVTAGAGAAGITHESARPILSEDYSQAKIRSAYLRYSGELASTEALYQGRLAKYEGKQALWKGILGGVTNVLGTASNIGRIKIAQGLGSGIETSPGGLLPGMGGP